VEYGAKTLKVQDKNIKLQIWDTVTLTQAGQESFRAITRTFYRNANGVILMYDLTRMESFESLTDWLKEVRQNSDPDVVIYLVGNMLDLADEEREVSTTQASEFSKMQDLAGFTEASAKTAQNVNEVRQ
jgi:small GTP-binding protein